MKVVSAFFLTLLLLLLTMVILSPVTAAPDPTEKVLPLAVLSLNPGIGDRPDRMRIDPINSAILVHREGGTTVVSDTMVIRSIPGLWVADGDPQTGHRFAVGGHRVVILNGWEPIQSITLPYTATRLAYSRQSGSLYVVMQKSVEPPLAYELAVIRDGAVRFTMTLGTYGTQPVVHPDTGYAYIAGNYTVTVMNGANVLASIPVSGSVTGMRVYPGYPFVLAWGQPSTWGNPGWVAWISGTTRVASIPFPGQPYDLSADPGRGRVYVTGLSEGIVVITGTGASTSTIQFPGWWNTLDVHPANGNIYAANHSERAVYIFSPNLRQVAVLSTSLEPTAVQAHPTGRVYVLERDLSSPREYPHTALFVISGTERVAEIPSGYGLGPIAVRPQDGRVFALDMLSGTVFTISGTEVLSSVTLTPWFASPILPLEAEAAVDPSTGWLYVRPQAQWPLFVISDTGVLSISLLATALQADSAHGVVWVGSRSELTPTLTVLSGGQILTSVLSQDLYGLFREIAVDADRGWLYAHNGWGVAVFSITDPITQTFWVTTLVEPEMYPPRSLVVEPVSGRAYVGTADKIWVLNGPSIEGSQTVAGSPVALAADGNGRVYGALAGAQQVVVISGTETVNVIHLPFDPSRVWVSPGGKRVYVAGSYELAVLKEMSVESQWTTGTFPHAMAFDADRRRAYLTHRGDNRLLILEEKMLPWSVWLPLVLRNSP